MGVEDLRKGRFPLSPTVEAIEGLEEKNRWEIMRQEFQGGVEAVLKGKPVLFFLVDNTKAGGPHLIRMFLNPLFNAALVEIPEENQPGRLPTILHALEAVVTVKQLAHTAYPEASGSLSYPVIRFVKACEFDMALQQIPDHEIGLIPLIVDPERTNCVIFHPNARHLDPQAIAYGYYSVLAKMDLTVDLMRHTMLVTPRNPDYGPDSNKGVTVEAWAHREIGHFFSLLNPGRIGLWHSQRQPGPIYGVTLRNPFYARGGLMLNNSEWMPNSPCG